MPPEKRPHLMMLAIIDASLVDRVDPLRESGEQRARLLLAVFSWSQRWGLGDTADRASDPGREDDATALSFSKHDFHFLGVNSYSNCYIFPAGRQAGGSSGPSPVFFLSSITSSPILLAHTWSCDHM